MRRTMAARSASSCCCLLAAADFACSRLSRALRTRFTWELRQLEAVFFAAVREMVTDLGELSCLLDFTHLDMLEGVGSEE